MFTWLVFNVLTGYGLSYFSILGICKHLRYDRGIQHSRVCEQSVGHQAGTVHWENYWNCIKVQGGQSSSDQRHWGIPLRKDIPAQSVCDVFEIPFWREYS